MRREISDKVRGVLRISAPRIECCNEKARLCADITTDGVAKCLWFEVDQMYGQYLCDDRSDAFLIGLLWYAMHEHLDIECEAKVGEELLHQIRVHLIPALSAHSKNLYPSKIIAAIDSAPYVNAGGVGTGASLGVDSMHAIAKYANSEYPNLRLTHLVMNNVGSFWTNEGQQYFWQLEHARKFCKTNGFELIETNSNYADVLRQNHSLTHTYSSCFCIFALQKLWKCYFYGSTYDYSKFTVTDNDLHDPAYYELLSLQAFSTSNLRLFSEGGAQTRFEKTRDVIAYAPSYDYLHVCWMDHGPNCMTCGKCRRTLVTLDALSALDLYAKSFDTAYYRSHRTDYLKWLYRQIAIPGGDKMVDEAYNILKNNIGVYVRLCVWKCYLIMRVKRILSKVPGSVYAWHLLKDVVKKA